MERYESDLSRPSGIEGGTYAGPGFSRTERLARASPIERHRRRRRSRWVGTAVLTLMLVPVVSAAQGPQLMLPDMSQLSQKASETVDISLDSSLLGLAGQFITGEGEDEKTVKELLQSLRGIYVRAFEFDVDGAFSTTDVDAIRRQFSTPGWSRLVGVRSRREKANVDVYVWTDGKKPGGVAILAVEPRKLTIVNLVGTIDLEKLRRLEGEFGIPKLELERKPKQEQ
jgi:hypothetical protein